MVATVASTAKIQLPVELMTGQRHTGTGGKICIARYNQHGHAAGKDANYSTLGKDADDIIRGQESIRYKGGGYYDHRENQKDAKAAEEFRAAGLGCKFLFHLLTSAAYSRIFSWVYSPLCNSPDILPSHITRMRSDIPMISSMSEETMIMDTPCSVSSFMIW